MAGERRSTLEALAELNQDVDLLRLRLATFDWDWAAEPLLVITSGHVRAVLHRFVAGQLDAQAIEDWANLLELRDDVGFEDGFDGVVRTAIHVLANPLLEGLLTEERVGDVLRRLAAG